MADELAVETGAANPQFLNPENIWTGLLQGGSFDQQSRGTDFPPDNFDMDVGDWGTDAELDAAGTYFTSRTGSKVLVLHYTIASGTQTKLVSGLIPVSEDKVYRMEAIAAISVTSGTEANAQVNVNIDWLQSDQSTSTGGTGRAFASTSVANQWQRGQVIGTPPANTRWAQITIQVNGVGVSVDYDAGVDLIAFEEITPSFRARRNSGGNQSLTAGAWSVANFTSEAWDYGNCFDPSTNQFTAPVEGIYQFSVCLYLDNMDPNVDIEVDLNSGTSARFWAVTDLGSIGTARNSPFVFSTTWMMKLSEGHTVRIRIRPGSSSSSPTLGAFDTSTYFEGSRVR